MATLCQCHRFELPRFGLLEHKRRYSDFRKMFEEMEPSPASQNAENLKSLIHDRGVLGRFCPAFMALANDWTEFLSL